MQKLAARREAVVKAVSTTRGRIASVIATIAFIVAGPLAGASHATSPTDLTDGAGDTFFSTITSYFTGDVLPAVLALMALTVGVGVLIKWGKRAAKSS